MRPMRLGAGPRNEATYLPILLAVAHRHAVRAPDRFLWCAARSELQKAQRGQRASEPAMYACAVSFFRSLPACPRRLYFSLIGHEHGWPDIVISLDRLCRQHVPVPIRIVSSRNGRRGTSEPM